MSRFENKTEISNALRLKFYAQDWNATSLDNGNFLFKYLGIDASLYYIFVDISFKNDFITLKAQFPHTFEEANIDILFTLCNVVNRSYLLGNLFLDIEKTQIFLQTGIQSFQSGKIEKLIVSYLYTMLDQMEVINKMLLEVLRNDINEYEINFELIKQKDNVWEKERKIKNWSFEL